MKHRFIKHLCFSLALLLLLPALFSCGGKGKTLLTLEKDGIKAELSVNLYELMLSRLKGSLVSSGVTAGGYEADEDKFWDYLPSDPTKTLNDLYKEAILDNCKTYTAALWLFEKRGLSLSAAEIEEVDARLKELITELADGSKTKFNSLLASYGVNYKMLREAYLMEAKLSLLQTDLYGENGSLLGTDLKDEYLKAHYVRFKQVFLPNYTYEYETDKFGDEIYYDPEYSEAIIAYDQTNGQKKFSGGIFETDSNGDEIYYTDGTYTHIAYDKVNGRRAAKLDSTGTAITKNLSETELQALSAKAQETFQTLKTATPAEFEEAIQQDTATSTADTLYTTDCYLNVDTDYGSEYSYLSEMVEKLQGMNEGEVALVQSSSGYHIIMKYAPASGAYDDENNEAWFSNYYSNMIETYFLEYCRSYREEVVVNDAVYQSSKSFKEISANYYY